jgi:hypothetical protein
MLLLRADRVRRTIFWQELRPARLNAAFHLRTPLKVQAVAATVQRSLQPRDARRSGSSRGFHSPYAWLVAHRKHWLTDPVPPTVASAFNRYDSDDPPCSMPYRRPGPRDVVPDEQSPNSAPE